MDARTIGEAYAEGNKAYDECPVSKWEIDKLNIEMYIFAVKDEDGKDYFKKCLKDYLDTVPKPTHNCNWCNRITSSEIKE